MTPTVTNRTYLHIRGFNYQPSYGSTGYELWRKFDPLVIDRELGLGKTYFPAMNAIRLWLSWDAFVREPARYAANFETALAIAGRHALKVMPVLFNRWHDPVLDYGGIYIDHFLPGVSYIQKPGMFDPFMEQIVGAHADDARIFAWDLCNEPFHGKDDLAAFPDIKAHESDWLAGLYRQCKQLGARAPVTVGCHPATRLEVVNDYSDLLSIHPYWAGYFKYTDDLTFEQWLDVQVAFANKVEKPLIASETCWGSEDDAERVAIIRYTMDELHKRNIPFTVYLLHHSLIADAHRAEFGPVGRPGNLSFIEADGSLRPGHEIWNEFAG